MALELTTFALTDGMRDVFDASKWQIRELKQRRHTPFVIVPESENENIKKCTYLLLRACKAELAREGGLTTLRHGS